MRLFVPSAGRLIWSVSVYYGAWSVPVVVVQPQRQFCLSIGLRCVWFGIDIANTEYVAGCI